MTSNSSIITEIQGYLFEPESSEQPQLVDSTMTINLLNRAIDELCIDTEANYNVYSYTEASALSPESKTFSELTGGAESYILKLKDLLVKQVIDSDYRKIDRTNLKDKKNLQDDEYNNIYYANIYSDTVWLSAGLATGDEILISGRWKKPVQVAGGTFPLHPMTEQAVIYYCVAMGFYIRGQVETGDRWYALYLTRKETVLNYFDNLIKSKYPNMISPIKTGNVISNNIQGAIVV